MSFGFSPSDVIKLMEISSRVYGAFKDENGKSEAQVKALVLEFQTFAQHLLDLDKMMKRFGRPLPFPVDDFKETLAACEASLKPYKKNLLGEQKMGLSKMFWAIRYIGQEKELDILRKRVAGHSQALIMRLNALNIEYTLESSKQIERMLLEPRNRAFSTGDEWWIHDPLHTLSHSSPPSPLALPAPQDTHPLYQAWAETTNRPIQGNDGAAHALQFVQSSPWGGLSVAMSDDDDAAAMRERLRRQLEDAIVIRENRAKRAAMEKRSHLSPSDAMKQQVREMVPVPASRAYTIEEEEELNSVFEAFGVESHPSESVAMGKMRAATPSPGTSPASPHYEQEYFDVSRRTHSPTMASERLSVSTIGSSGGSPTDMRYSPAIGIGLHTTAETTPDNAFGQPAPAQSLGSFALPESAMQWTILCRNVCVERRSKEKVKPDKQDCKLIWSLRADGGVSIRAMYRPREGEKAKIWTQQDLPAFERIVPLSTTIHPVLSVNFPSGSYGRLNKSWTDISYTFSEPDASSKAIRSSSKLETDSAKFQTLIYTNNGKDPAELLFDRPMKIISTDKHRPGCRGKNLRLWRRTEVRFDTGAPVEANVLTLLFYTNCLERKAHWVEEPQHAFDPLAESVYKKKSTDKLTLVFSGNSSTWKPDKLMSGWRSPRGSTSHEGPVSPVNGTRKDSMEPPELTRTRTNGSVGSVSASSRGVRSPSVGSNIMGSADSTNSWGYAKLDLEFESSGDRETFLTIWRKHV